MTTRGQQLKVQTMTPANQIIVLTTNPKIPLKELKKLKAELEERYRINTECIEQNLSMQHHRDLQIVRDDVQRRFDTTLNQVRSSEEKAIAQNRQIDNLQSQLNQLSQLVRQQQQMPTNIATPYHNMTQQHNFSLPPPSHTQSYTPTHTGHVQPKTH